MFQRESLLIPDSTVGVNVPSMRSAWSHRLSEHCSIFQPCPSLIRTLGPPAHPPPVTIFQILLLCVGHQPIQVRLIVPGLKCRVEIRGDGRKVVQSAWSRPLWSTVDVRDNPPANNLRLISMQQKVSGFSETRRRGVQACVPIPAREQH